MSWILLLDIFITDCASSTAVAAAFQYGMNESSVERAHTAKQPHDHTLQHYETTCFPQCKHF